MKKLYSCGIFIYLQEAFHIVDYDILLCKLKYYGIKGVANCWFCSQYKSAHISLKVRLLPVVLHKVRYFDISNDISYSSNQLNFFLFADDTNLLYADTDFRSLELTVNRELAIVCNWLMANKFSLNTKKSNFVIFRP